jgi:hypothetical protein
MGCFAVWTVDEKPYSTALYALPPHIRAAHFQNLAAGIWNLPLLVAWVILFYILVFFLPEMK